MASARNYRFVRLTVLTLALVFVLGPAPGQVVSRDRVDADSAFAAFEYKKAIESYTKVVQEDPSDSEAWFRLGFSLHEQARYKEAIAAYQKALDRKYFVLTTRYDIASAYSRLGQTDQALSHLQEAVLAGYFVPQQISSDSDFDNLHGNPRYEQIVSMARAAVDNYSNSRALDWLLHQWTANGRAMNGTRLTNGFAVAISFSTGQDQTCYLFLTFDASKTQWNVRGAGPDDTTYTGIADAHDGSLAISGTTLLDGKEVEAELKLTSAGERLSAVWRAKVGGSWVDRQKLEYSEGPAT